MNTRGEVKSFSLTPRDMWILKNVVRWYTMSTEQLLRSDPRFDDSEWHPDLGGDPTIFGRGNAGYARRRGIEKRLFKLSNVVDNTSSGVLPMIDSAWLNPHLTIHSATTFGARVCALNGWVGTNNINYLTARHATAAVDIGTQIERVIRAFDYTGLNVLSEREVRRNDTVGHRQELDPVTRQPTGIVTVPAKFESRYRGENAEKGVAKIPDLAVCSPNWERYIAVEIERETDRNLSTYVEKFQAYRNNPSIDAVWYVCASPTVTNRVVAAAKRVFGDRSARVRIVTAHTQYGFWQINGLDVAAPQAAYFHADLQLLLTRQNARGIMYEGTD